MTAHGPNVENFALYHWAPSARRRQIIRYGLRPGSRSSCGLWKPPYVCLANSPYTAWQLIGRFRPHIASWDLWWTTSGAAGPMELIPMDDGSAREYRVYHRIFKRDLWFVGSRRSEFWTPPVAAPLDDQSADS